MWPLNTLTNRRHACRRVALRAGWLLCLALASHADGAAATLAGGEKDVQRAEKIVTKLRQLDEAAAREDASTLRAVASKLYPGLFVTVADMRASELKTDLDTAVFMYERIVRTWFTTGAATLADCAGERPDIYLPLCRELSGGTTRQLLLAKARLHVRWAEAVVKASRGESDDATSRALSEMKTARDNDLLIAARIVETLKPLEEIVNVPATHAEYLERGSASQAGFDKLEGACADALDVTGALLSSLPRSPLFYHLSNAYRDYSDGLHWQRKVSQSKQLVVSANAFTSDPLKDLRLNAEQVGYVAVSNWRSALKHTRMAEQTISGLLRR